MGKDKTEQVSTGDKIAFFIQKNRKVLLALIIIIASGIALSVAFFTIRDTMAKKAIAKVEFFEQRMNDLGIPYENADSAEANTLLEEINAFAPSAFGYAAARAYFLAANIYFARSDWNRAEESWVKGARKAPKKYLAPVCLFNAAAAAEEQGKKTEAIIYFKESLDYPGVFPAAAKARFNIGRIHEELYEKDKAREAYLELIEKNPESSFANFAHNRLIVLEKN